MKKQIKELERLNVELERATAELEKFLKKSKHSVTVEECYRKVSKNMDRNTYDTAIKHLLNSTHFRIDKKSGCLYTAWDPEGIKKALNDETTLF